MKYGLNEIQTLTIQRALNRALASHRKPIVEDGVRGRETNLAIRFFKALNGLGHNSIIDGATLSRLIDSEFQKSKIPVGRSMVPDTPWMDEALRRMHLHEKRDNAKLFAWLKSGGGSVGDPAKNPWCGDFVETAIALTLPDEVLPSNPYLAANWTKAGIGCVPQYGAILSFWRESPSSWKGHVALYVAEDDVAYHVLGGNQKNAVTVTRLLKTRLRRGGCRWPATASKPTGGPRIVARGANPLSHNEA